MLPSRSPQEARVWAAECGLRLLTSPEEFASRLVQDEETLETLRSFESTATASSGDESEASELVPLRWNGQRAAPTMPELATQRHEPTWISVSDDPRVTPGGPLTGWEVGVKDLMAVEGCVLTAGTRAHTARLFKQDAPAVAALRAAGATIRGTTNLHSLAYGATGLSSDWGVPANPAVPGALPGGSSSGSASAVAERTAALTLGTDTSGSIRIPAALCGVVGLKPTRGLISREGCHPLSPNLDHIGPLGASVGVLAAAMTALTDWGEWRLPEEPDGTLRLGVLGGYFTEGLSASVRSAFERACVRLTGAGVELVPVELPLARHVPGAQIALLGTEALQSNLDTLREHGAQLPADVRLRLEAGLARTQEQYAVARTFAARLSNEVSSAFRHCHGLISATTAITATPPDVSHVDIDGEQVTVQFSLTRLTMPFNFSGHPALTLPIHEATADPVGLQVIGRMGGDQDLLALSAYVEQILA